MICDCGTTKIERRGILLCPECDDFGDDEDIRVARAGMLDACVTDLLTLWETCTDEKEKVDIRLAVLALERRTK